MADKPRNERNQQRQGFGHEQLDRRARIHLHDQIFRPANIQPRQETIPIEENQDFLGQAVLQSMQDTDGDATIHDGFLFQGNSYQLPDIGQAVRPYGSVPVYMDDLPLLSNGGVSFPPNLLEPSPTDHGIQETLQDQTGSASKLAMRDFEGSTHARKLSDSDVSMESENGETTLYIQIDATSNKTPKYFNDELVESYQKAPKKFFSTPQLHPNTLAKEGLRYTGEGDKVECYCCHLQLSEWEVGDDPVVEHIRLGGPEICPHLKKNKDNGMLRDIQKQLRDKGVNGNPPPMAIGPEVSQSRQMSQEVFGTVPKITGGMDAFSSGNQASGFWSSMTDALSSCQDCRKNTVTHTLLKCGHNVCSECMKNLMPHFRREVATCKTCNRPVTDFASYTPGCQN